MAHQGNHGKSYFPRMFPQTLPKRYLVLQVTYKIIADQWANSYRGYRPKTSSLLDFLDEEENAELLAKVEQIFQVVQC